MKKLTLLFVTLLCLGFMFQACDDTKTYAEQLEDEDNAIKDFISKNNIKVLSLADFEAKGNTTDLKTNEYVALSGGVYMQIVDKGTGDSINNNCIFSNATVKSIALKVNISEVYADIFNFQLK